MGEPEFIDVFGVRRFRLAAGMCMEIDETGCQVHAAGIDLMCAAWRPAGWIDRHMRDADVDYLRDSIALHDDIHGPTRLSAGSVDDRNAANHQTIERPFAFA